MWAVGLSAGSACLEGEVQLRAREYAAFHRVAAYAAASGAEGALDKGLLALPRPQLADAASCLYKLGWSIGNTRAAIS